MRIVFMGTPDFAVLPLAALIEEGFDIAAVVTQPDRPSGRGNKLTPCPVKVLAQRHGLPVLQYERIRGKEGVEALRALAPDMFVTAAFGQILSRRVLAIPRLGTVNLHASLLPQYRGPAPVNWCIAHGETETGVTTMMTDEGIDTGDVLLAARTAIGLEETAGDLTNRLSALGAPLLVETLRRIARGDCPRRAQDSAQATRHPMLQKEHGRVDWTQSAQQIACLVRGMNPWPAAWTTLPDGTVLKIWRAQAHEADVRALTAQAGEVIYADDKRGLFVACGSGMLEIVALQAPGARRMQAKDYLCGHPVVPGTRFGKEPIHGE